MTNLIIGLCFGIAAAVALAIMWRMVERFRKEAQSGNSPDRRGAPGESPPVDQGEPGAIPRRAEHHGK